MSASEKPAAVASAKGPDEVPSKLAPAFPATQPTDVFGFLPARGSRKTLEEMDAGVLDDARRRDARIPT